VALRDLPEEVTTFTNEVSLLLTAWGRTTTFEKERTPEASAVWILSPMAKSEKSLAAPDSRVTVSSPEKHTPWEEDELDVELVVTEELDEDVYVTL
jgi:hypothetical protein